MASSKIWGQGRLRSYSPGGAGSVGPCWRGECLAPPLACNVVAGSIASMHMVAATLRISRQALLMQAEPSRRQLRALVTSVSSGSGPHGAPIPQQPRQRFHKMQHEPELIVDWLAATVLVRDIRKTHQASLAFARIFACARLQVPEHGPRYIAGSPSSRRLRCHGSSSAIVEALGRQCTSGDIARCCAAVQGN